MLISVLKEKFTQKRKFAENLLTQAIQDIHYFVSLLEQI